MNDQDLPEDQGDLEEMAIDDLPEGEIESEEDTSDEPEEITRESLEAQIADLKDKLLRALAESDNARRIAAREKADASKYAIANFARDLVGVSDNMSMALMSAPAEARQADQSLDNLCVGIEMTQKELLSAFERNGIKKVKDVGTLFDHNIHEAVQQVPNPDLPEGTVVQAIRGGFTLQGRLLRAAQVLVSSGGPKPEKAKADTAPEGDAPTPSQAKGYAGDSGASGQQIDEEL